MPSSGKSMAFPPDPDAAEQEEIVAAVIYEWSELTGINADDVEDCAGNIVEALNNRRWALIEDAISLGVLPASAGADIPGGPSDLPPEADGPLTGRL